MASPRKKSDKDAKKKGAEVVRDWQTIHVPMKLTIVSRVDRRAEIERRTRVAMISLLVEKALDATEGANA